MTKSLILEVTHRAINKKHLKRCIRAIERDDFNEVDKIVQEELKNATEETLESVNAGNCDMVIFDHYRTCRILIDLINKYKENDTRS